jgi:hypothetical protein
MNGSGVDTKYGYPGPACVLAADIDADGRPDIVAGNSYTNTYVIYQNISQY